MTEGQRRSPKRIIEMVKRQGRIQEFLIEDALLKAGHFLGIIDKRINIPSDILALAAERGIIAKEPYIKNNDGQTIDGSGSPIKTRDNPERIEKERQSVIGYLTQQSEQENKFIDGVLNDPNSDTKVDLHQAGIEKINTRRLQSMSLECRAAVIIPARFEEKNIKEILEGYSKQTEVSPKQFEINVIVNHRIDEQPDNTTEVVLQFMDENPDLNINLIDLQFDKRHANVSWARKIISDLVLSRAIRRSGYWSPLYIITEDADVNKVDPSIVKKAIQGFDTDPAVDCIRGRQDRSNALIAQNYLCALKYRGDQMVETILRHKALRNPYRQGYNFDWNRVVSGGWASAFTAEAYALIGGYIEGITVGEDVAIGQLCSIARGYKDSIGNVVPFLDITKKMPIRNESNFLRIGNEIITGISAYSKDQFENQDIKKKSELEILECLRKYKRINPEDKENVQRFENVVKGSFYFLRGCVGNDSEFIRYYAPFFLLALGFKRGDYEIDGKQHDIQLIINNWTNVANCLDRNKEKYRKELEERYI